MVAGPGVEGAVDGKHTVWHGMAHGTPMSSTVDGTLPHAVTNLHHARLHDFRQMAKRPDVVEQAGVGAGSPLRGRALKKRQGTKGVEGPASADLDAYPRPPYLPQTDRAQIRSH